MQHNQLTRLFGARRTVLSGRDAYPLHDHDFGEIFWIEEGECVHEVNGRKFLLGAGDCLFIRPPDAHRFSSKNGNAPFCIVNICFQWHVLETMKRRYFGGCGVFYGESEKLPKTIQLRPRQKDAMRSLFLDLIKAPQTAFYIERFLINLFAELAPPGGSGVFVRGVPPHWLRQAWNLVQHPAHMRLGPREFQKLCGRCPEHVSREFRRYSGRTVSDAMDALRMEHAAALLAGTSSDIVNIAAECGYESLSHFYTRFRRMFGRPPARFRRESQAGLYRARE